MDPITSFAELLPSLADVRASLATALPRLAAAALVLLLGWMFAVLVRAMLRRSLRSLGRRLPAGLARIAWTEAVHERGGGSVVASGVYWIVIVATVMIATETLGLPILTTWLAAVTSYLPKVLLAAAIVFAGIVAGRLGGDAVRRATKRLAPQQARQLGRLTRLGIIATSVLLATGQLGLDVSLLTTVFLIVLGTTLGGAALAFGLGARGVIADILAMHYFLKSYSIGQRVRIGEDQGRITRASATAVFLEHPDGEIAIPGRAVSEQRCVRVGRGDVDDA